VRARRRRERVGMIDALAVGYEIRDGVVKPRRLTRS
jgi:hypothetical protein